MRDGFQTGLRREKVSLFSCRKYPRKRKNITKSDVQFVALARNYRKNIPEDRETELATFTGVLPLGINDAAETFRFSNAGTQDRRQLPRQLYLNKTR